MVQDTREQSPWIFEGLTQRKNKQDIPLAVEVVVDTLQTGDYSIRGHEHRITIERKSSHDLIGTVSHDRDRFVRELERMAEMPHSFVVVESEWQSVLLDCWTTTNYNPKSLDSSILAWQLKYPTQWLFRPNKFSAMKTAYKIFDLYYRKEANDAT